MPMRYDRLRGEERVNMAYRNHPRVIRISGTGPYGCSASGAAYRRDFNAAIDSVDPDIVPAARDLLHRILAQAMLDRGPYPRMTKREATSIVRSVLGRHNESPATSAPGEPTPDPDASLSYDEWSRKHTWGAK